MNAGVAVVLTAAPPAALYLSSAIPASRPSPYVTPHAVAEPDRGQQHESQSDATGKATAATVEALPSILAPAPSPSVDPPTDVFDVALPPPVPPR